MPPRRSARLQTVDAQEKSVLNYEEDDSEEQSSSRVAPRRKRQKRAGNLKSRGSNAPQKPKISVRRKRGSLWKLPEMPLDILFEIFELLDPLDLLHLSRTTKPLRNCLMSRSTASVWSRARSNIEGFPECPTNLSEPQFARLAFEFVCHFCGTFGVTDVLWNCWVRSCQKCIEKNFVTEEEVHIEIPQCNNQLLLPILDPRPKRYNLLYLKSQVVALSQKLAATKNQASIDQVLQETTALATTARNHVLCCEEWYHTFRINRARELDQARKNRQAAIREKLTELGWGEEFEKFSWRSRSDFEKHPQVNQTRPLTARIWKNISESMLEFFAQIKKERLDRERTATLCGRLKIMKELMKQYSLTRSHLELIPSVADVYDMLQFKNLIHLPSEIEVNEASFAGPMSQIDALTDIWFADIYSTLRLLMPDEKPFSETNAETFALLRRATTFFKCYSCKEPVSCPQIIVHRCMTRLDMSLRRSDDASPETMCLLYLGIAPCIYNVKKLEFDWLAHATAEAIVKACARHPLYASQKEIEDMDWRFICPYCSGPDELVCMTWRRAIYHVHKEHGDEPLNKNWTVLDNDRLSEIQAIEEEDHRERLDSMSVLCCTKCRQERMTPNQLVLHYVSSHYDSIEDIHEDEQAFYVHPDIPGDSSPRVVKLPSTPPAKTSVSSVSNAADDGQASDDGEAADEE